MSTKANIQTQINTIDDGGVNTASEVRSVLGTDPNSLLESVYNDIVLDTNILQTITTANANFQYSIKVYEVGRSAVISGSLTCVNTQNIGSTVFVITDTDLQTTSKASSTVGIKPNTSDKISLSYNTQGGTTSLKVSQSIFVGETYNFTMVFNKIN